MTPEEIRQLITTKSVHHIDYSDFENIVKSVYGQDYEFTADEETPNDSSHSYSAKKGNLNERNRKDIETFMNTGKYQYLASAFIEDLVDRELLPEGEFLIEVCW